MAEESPLVHIVGLGPAGPDLITAGTLALIERVDTQFLRTERHPAAVAMPHAQWFDRLYDAGESMEQVYTSICDAVVRAALSDREVLYAVPGSPVVAERTVQLLLADDRVRVQIHPALSFLDLAWARLGVDPVALGVELVDGHTLGDDPLELTGPVLVAQCDTRFVLSDLKLAVDGLVGSVTVLHHLGLDDEQVVRAEWEDLDRCIEPDHLTSVWLDDLQLEHVRRSRPRRRRLGRAIR